MIIMHAMNLLPTGTLLFVLAHCIFIWKRGWLFARHVVFIVSSLFFMILPRSDNLIFHSAFYALLFFMSHCLRLELKHRFSVVLIACQNTLLNKINDLNCRIVLFHTHQIHFNVKWINVWNKYYSLSISKWL